MLAELVAIRKAGGAVPPARVRRAVAIVGGTQAGSAFGKAPGLAQSPDFRVRVGAFARRTA